MIPVDCIVDLGVDAVQRFDQLSTHVRGHARVLAGLEL
jgi:hypothetical protein